MLPRNVGRAAPKVWRRGSAGKREGERRARAGDRASGSGDTSILVFTRVEGGRAGREPKGDVEGELLTTQNCWRVTLTRTRQSATGGGREGPARGSSASAMTATSAMMTKRAGGGALL